MGDKNLKVKPQNYSIVENPIAGIHAPQAAKINTLV